MAWDQQQLANAQTIIKVGLGLGMSRRDIRIGLMVALQESGLRNLDYGDRDSLGIFQQRPSQGWGTPDQVTNAEYAAQKFFNALKGVKNRDEMSLTLAGQAVQRSAYPYAYADDADDAAQLLKQLGFSGGGGRDDFRQPKGQNIMDQLGPEFKAITQPTVPVPMSQQLAPTADTILGAGPVLAPMDFSEIMAPQYDTEDAFKQIARGGRGGGAATGDAGKMLKFAKRFIGTPYVWGGTTPSGFDCSGFTQYVFKKFGIDLPRVSADQGRMGKRISLDKLKPGELVFWDNSARNNGADHVAIYLGNGKIIEAPRPGRSVQISSMYDQANAWGVRL